MCAAPGAFVFSLTNPAGTEPTKYTVEDPTMGNLCLMVHVMILLVRGWFTDDGCGIT